MTGRKSMQTSTSGRRSSHAGSRSGMFGTSLSRRNVAFDSKLDRTPLKKASVQVFDETGQDVTPRSLLLSDPTTQSTSGKNNSKSVINFNDSSSVGTPSEMFNQSMFGASTFQASYAAGFSRSIMSSMMGSSRASLDSVTDEISEPSHLHTFAGLQDIERKRNEVREALTSADLKKLVTITLEETDTIWHLDIPGVVATSSNVEDVKERNQKYDQLCANRTGNDMYIHCGVQTFNDALKAKEMQTLPVEVKDIGCLATTWDLYDTYNEKEKEVEEDAVDDDIFAHTAGLHKEVAQTNVPIPRAGQFNKLTQSDLTESSASFISSSSISVAADPDNLESERSSVAPSDTNAQLTKIMKLNSMKDNLFIVERIIVQNLYHTRQAAYRGAEDLVFAPRAPVDEETEEENETKLGPNISRLWSYECLETRGFAVTCMVWNKDNPDLLGVGYGENGFSADGKGMACIWSIKNPEFPERMYRTKSAIVSIDFSASHPNFLAVGLYNGTIAVYNVRSTVDAPLLDNVESVGKHAAPVWQLRWVEREKGTGEEKGELLISSSADGRVTQWSIRKGFEFMDLMKLKRINVSKQADKKSDAAAAKKNDALISRYAAGMCFDFHPVDGNIYIAGTEEGHIHRCSCSYNEQFLETYSGHKGSVYRTLWSPFNKNAFLSCSADWSVRLWHVDKLQPIITLQASTKGIVDIDWSPKSASMFAAINEQQIEIWDLSVSTLDPLLVNLPVKKVKLTSIKFALNSEALFVGDCEGHVTIYQLREMNLGRENQTGALLSRIMKSTLSQNDGIDENSTDDVESDDVDR